ncbi:hypothetical protein L3Q82_004937 [Scortum barcoo]|uniref:Uncharacterized protein n=1 Tax=Scortum barcoo TaxID=214431 RepID=A0ACB8VE25_9TELE|nr:hypothetical protein L3Q82_004937 [Scortum barcoo]
MVFAIEEINNSTELLPGIKLGYLIHDTCASVPLAVHVAFQLSNGLDSMFYTGDNCSRSDMVMAIVGAATDQRVCDGTEDIKTLQSPYTETSQLRITNMVYKAVYAIAHAIHNLVCEKTNSTIRCDKFSKIESKQVLTELKKVNFSQNGYDMSFDANGDPVARYELVNWQKGESGRIELVTVGHYDASLPSGQDFRINKNLIWVEGGTQVPVSVCSDSCPPGTRKVLQKGKPICCHDCVPCPEGEISNAIDSPDCFRCPKEFWPNTERDTCFPKPVEFLSFDEVLGIILAAFSVGGACLAIITAAVFFCHRTSPIVRANNSELSFLLLFSLTLCFLCPLTFIGPPSEWSCMLRHTAFGITFVLCISCVLGKTIVVLMAFRATLPVLSPPFPMKNLTTYKERIILECALGSAVGFWAVLGYTLTVKHNYTTIPEPLRCTGSIDARGLRFSRAMVFAIKEINNSTELLPGIKLGYLIHDYVCLSALGRSTAVVVVAFVASGDMRILLEELSREPSPPRQWIGSESWVRLQTRECVMATEDIKTLQSPYTDTSQLRITNMVYKAVYAIAHAIHNAVCQKTNSTIRCDKFSKIESKQVLTELKKVNFSQNGYDVSFDANGDPVARYELVNWQKGESGRIELVTVGHYDASLPSGQDFRINKNLIWVEGGTQVPVSVCSDSCPPGTRKVLQKGKPICCHDCVPCPEGEISNATDSPDCFRCPKEFWPNTERDTCFPKPVEFLSFDEVLGIILAAFSGATTTESLDLGSLAAYVLDTWVKRGAELSTADHHLVVSWIRWQRRKLEIPGRPKRIVRRESSLGTAGCHLCFLQMMLSCWLHQTRTFSMYWSAFAAECEAAGLRISTSTSEAMVLDRKRVACPLQVGGEVLPQVEEFKYLGVLFTSEGKMEHEIDRRLIGAASAALSAVGVLDHRGEEVAESKGEALNLPVNLTLPHSPMVMNFG